MGQKGRETPYKTITLLLVKVVVLTHENFWIREAFICVPDGLYVCMWETCCDNQSSFLHRMWTDQLWKMFICLWRIKWVRTGNIKGLLNCCNRDGNAAKKEDGRLSLHAFRGQCGKKGIRDVLKKCRATCRSLKWIVYLCFFSWCKQKLMLKQKIFFMF